MRIFKSASILLLSAVAVVGCDRVDTSASVDPAAAEAQKPAPKDPKLPVETREPTKQQPPLVKPSDLPTKPAEPGVNPVGAATLEFQKRIQAYLKLHNEAERKVPNLKRTDDPKEITDREKALASMIMKLRAGAHLGDVFAPEYQPYFIDIVQKDFASRSAADRKALIWELPRDMKVNVNTEYPTTIPLATFPPALLRKLPDLPPELEYRIVGRSLILRDVKANLIVDILRDVVPTIPT